jgi:ABC-type nitrate/sulfonate/bicarbonate transport system permease component
MIFSENRYPLFRTMLLAGVVMLSLFGLAVGRLIDWLEARLLLWR